MVSVHKTLCQADALLFLPYFFLYPLERYLPATPIECRLRPLLQRYGLGKSFGLSSCKK